MDKAYDMVRAFHRAFNLPMRDMPGLLSQERAQRRCAWMREEIEEFLEAGDVSDQADAMIDLIYFALGTMVEMGVRPEALFEIVHRANMDKLFPDGKPHYNASSKVIKPDGWRDPKPILEEAIARQMKTQAEQSIT